MKFTLLIMAAPQSCQTQQTALRFAKASIASGHEIYRVFFYNDGALTGNDLQTSPQDEASHLEAWQQLTEEFNIELCVCVASALKRGILSQEEAQRYNHDSSNLSSHFNIVGLGQLIDAQNQSDRVISFAR